MVVAEISRGCYRLQGLVSSRQSLFRRMFVMEKWILDRIASTTSDTESIGPFIDIRLWESPDSNEAIAIATELERTRGEELCFLCMQETWSFQPG